MYLRLVDSALRRIDQARPWMCYEYSPEKQHLLSSAVRLVGQLRSTLHGRQGDPLAANLDDLCEYMSRQLVAANLENRLATLDEVADLLRQVRSAWGMIH
jgi:flagellar protein FliS